MVCTFLGRDGVDDVADGAPYASMERTAAFRRSALSFEKSRSMGLRYGFFILSQYPNDRPKRSTDEK